MYKLYWDPGSAAMAPHAVLEEIGAAHELVLIDTEKGQQRSPEYKKLNPNARVPTLDHDGMIMFESAAICLYLCERHPEAKLMPEAGAPNRGLFLQWLTFLTNTVQEALMQWHHSDYYADDDACRHAVKAHSEKKLDKLWQQLDAALGRDGPYLLGDQFSVADIYLAMLSRWTRNQAKPAVTHPNVKRCVELVKARPAYQRMLRAQGIEQN